jgi:hypothetical protein
MQFSSAMSFPVFRRLAGPAPSLLFRRLDPVPAPATRGPLRCYAGKGKPKETEEGVYSKTVNLLNLPSSPFKKICAANRGEIAVRITRAGVELGLKTVRSILFSTPHYFDQSSPAFTAANISLSYILPPSFSLTNGFFSISTAHYLLQTRSPSTSSFQG